MRTRHILFVLTACVLAGWGLAACGQGSDQTVSAVGAAAGTAAAANQDDSTSDELDEHGRPVDCPKDTISQANLEEIPMPTDVVSMAKSSELVVIAKAEPTQAVTEMTQPKGQPQPFSGIPLTQTNLTVIETLRGTPSRDLVVTQFGDRCTLGVPAIINPGKTYVLFLNQAQPGMLVQLGRSGILEVTGDNATTLDKTALKQSLTLRELRDQIAKA